MLDSAGFAHDTGSKVRKKDREEIQPVIKWVEGTARRSLAEQVVDSTVRPGNKRERERERERAGPAPGGGGGMVGARPEGLQRSYRPLRISADSI